MQVGLEITCTLQVLLVKFFDEIMEPTVIFAESLKLYSCFFLKALKTRPRPTKTSTIFQRVLPNEIFTTG